MIDSDLARIYKSANETPFCLEGGLGDETVFENNLNIMSHFFPNCEIDYESSDVQCIGTPRDANATIFGYVGTGAGDEDYGCYVDSGTITCS